MTERKRGRMPSWALSTVLILVALFPGMARAASTIRVRYRSVDTVYLDAGQSAGLRVGDRVEVVRKGKVIGRLEIAFLAAHSASCHILRETVPIVVGDLVQIAGKSPAAKFLEPKAKAEPNQKQSATPIAWGPTATAEHQAERLPTVISGTISADWESFHDATSLGLDSSRMSLRLNFNARQIAGLPYQVHVRMRRYDYSRSGLSGTSVPASETRERLSEADLIYAPKEGRFSFSLGRLGVTPFIGMGYLDGVLGELALSRRLQLGAFYGSEPVLDQLSVDTARTKYGLFARLHSALDAVYSPWEVIFGGIRELDRSAVSRDYAVVESRYDGRGPFSFYQRAEIDLNRGWRASESKSSSQLSNFDLGMYLRLTKRARLSFSYDRFENYRTADTRYLPASLFDDRVRQGLRASLQWEMPFGLNVSLDAGLQQRQGDSVRSTVVGISLNDYDLGWGMSAGGNIQAFRNEFTRGSLVSLTTAKRFAGGHRIDLSVGRRQSTGRLFAPASSVYQWVRLGGWAELPWRLFAHADAEVDSGNEQQGRRLSVGIGARF